MKNLYWFLLLFIINPLFSQKHDLSFSFPERRVLAGLYNVYGLEGKGTIFYEGLKKMRAPRQFTFLSADGKTIWKSEEFNFDQHTDVFSDEKRISFYERNDHKQKISLMQYDERGKLLFKGDVKYEHAVFAFIAHEGKIFALSGEDNGRKHNDLFLQEVSPEGLKPLGALKPISLPDLDKDEWTFRTWIFAGYDSDRMLFFRKYHSMLKGRVNYHIAVTDSKGVLLQHYPVAFGGDGKFIYSSLNANAPHRYPLFNGEDFYKGRGFNSNEPGPAAFSDLRVDWANNCIYFFGKYASKTQAGIAIKEPEAWFVEKYDINGKKIWSKGSDFGKKSNDGPKFFPPTKLRLTNTVDGRGLLLRDFPGFNAKIAASGDSTALIKMQVSKTKQQFQGMGHTITGHNEAVMSWYHIEIIDSPVLELAFGEQAGRALKSHILQHGHSDSWYIIQKHTHTCTLLECDPLAERYAVWTVGF